MKLSWLGVLMMAVLTGCGGESSNESPAVVPENKMNESKMKNPNQLTPKPAVEIPSEESKSAKPEKSPEIDYTPTGSDKTEFTMKDYEKVKPGMSKEEVFAILGKNGKIVSNENGVVMIQWMNGNQETSSMTITFQNETVSGKACAGLK